MTAKKVESQNGIIALWLGVPVTWRTELVSIAKTFVATFAVAVAFSLETSGDIPWTADAFVALLTAATRSGITAVVALVVKQLASLK